MARYLYQYESYPASETLQEELHSLCEIIDDARENIEVGMLSAEEIATAEREIAEGKARIREIMKVDASWEPDNGDWRMGCY
jgi:hypothetical protein